MRVWSFTCLSLALFGLAWSLVACSSSEGSASGSATASGSAPSTVGGETAPQGGPAPSELQGNWLFRSEGGYLHLYLRENGYSIAEVRGDIVVDGDEIAFFNSNGTSCPPDPRPDVGRYKWRVTGKKLHLRPVGKDPCGGRASGLANTTFVRAG
jgi:hypothetical protein